MQNPNRPRQIVQIYCEYAKAGIQFMALTILIIGVGAASYVALRGIWMGAKIVLRAIGADGGL